MAKYQGIKVQGGEIVLWKSKDSITSLDVRLDHDTIWLTQQQISDLFVTERSVISKHLGNIFRSKELDRKSICAKFAHTARDGKTYQVEQFNLDSVLSVGYRVNSRRGTEFRIWATRILRNHIIKGYTLNEKLLKARVEALEELKSAVDVMGRIINSRAVTGPETEGLLRVIADYSFALFSSSAGGAPCLAHYMFTFISFIVVRPAPSLFAVVIDKRLHPHPCQDFIVVKKRKPDDRENGED